MARNLRSGRNHGEGPSNPNPGPRHKRRRSSVPEEGEPQHVVDNTRGQVEEEAREEEENQDEERGGEGGGEDVEEAHAEDDHATSFGPGSNGNSGSGGAGGGGGSASDDRDGSTLVRFSDIDVLDCCICCEPLCVPVFQCQNGHIACYVCCAKLRSKCPMCLLPIYIRNRAIEKVLESIKIACQNVKYGCRMTLTYSEKKDHERTCIYMPCLCPYSGCNFVAMSRVLSLHFHHEHEGCAVEFIYGQPFSVLLNCDESALVLQSQTDGTLFLLNNNILFLGLGNILNISCIGPNSSMPAFHYDMLVKYQGCRQISQSFANYVQARTDGINSSIGLLLVPFVYFGASKQIVVEICISKIDAHPGN